MCEQTALHKAVLEGRDDLVLNILREREKNNIDIDAQDGNGDTALDLAVESRNKVIMKMLYAYGARVCKSQNHVRLLVWIIGPIEADYKQVEEGLGGAADFGGLETCVLL